jgi:hypothetical protein
MEGDGAPLDSFATVFGVVARAIPAKMQRQILPALNHQFTVEIAG